MFAFIAYVVAAVCFALAWLEVDISHLHDAGWFFVALGFALSHLPAITVRRGP